MSLDKSEIFIFSSGSYAYCKIIISALLFTKVHNSNFFSNTVHHQLIFHLFDINSTLQKRILGRNNGTGCRVTCHCHCRPNHSLGVMRALDSCHLLFRGLFFVSLPLTPSLFLNRNQLKGIGRISLFGNHIETSLSLYHCSVEFEWWHLVLSDQKTINLTIILRSLLLINCLVDSSSVTKKIKLELLAKRGFFPGIFQI